VRELYSRCRAFVQTGSEDFGITPIEAMGGGAPVIAINSDGPAETIVDGQTGIFFDAQTPEALAQAVRRFEQIHSGFDSAAIRCYAESFDRSIFRQRFQAYVELKWEQFQTRKQSNRLVSVN